MSESVTRDNQPGGESVVDAISSLALELDGSYALTHSRFAISLPTSGAEDFIIQPVPGGRHDRYLIVPGASDRATYQQLSEAGIAQFIQRPSGNDVSIYSLPLQVKPLSKEKIFTGHVSSDTYVSDQELFGQLGTLWSRIYKVTGKIALEKILDKTALLDYEPDHSRLIPIPPYDGWVETPSADVARDKYIIAIKEQLESSNPRQSYQALLTSVEQAWNRENNE